MTNLYSTLKCRHYFANKAMVFPVVIYGCESWTIKKAECWALKNWCFWTVVLEKTLESPLYSKEIQLVHRKGNQSWISTGKTEAETPILWPLDVKSWTHRKRPWCWERLKVGGERVDRGWDGWMASLTQWTWVWVNSGSWWWTGKPGMLQSMGVSKSRTRLRDWTELTEMFLMILNIHLPYGTGIINRVERVQFSSVAQSCPTLCDPMDCSMPGLPVHHQLQEFTQTHVHWVGDATFSYYILLLLGQYNFFPVLSLSLHEMFP